MSGNQHAKIGLDRVSVSFPIYQGASRSLKKNLVFRTTGGQIGRDANDRITVHALHDISLNLQPGDRLALFGENGAGKTTLLRVLAGVYEPSEGTVYVRGKISSMLDLGVGIDPELTGYENIRLRALVLQIPRRDLEEKLEEITAFTELGDYLHMPVRTYSSGMLMRLTFAVSTCFVPDVVLMDEWILAADMHFMAKAQRRIRDFIEQATIFVLASHNLELLSDWCTKGLWLQNGKMRAMGPLGPVLDAYRSELQ